MLTVRSQVTVCFIWQAINAEEQLLDFEQTPFLILMNMLNQVEPFDLLWHTVLDFHQSYDKWYNGMLDLSRTIFF